MNLITYITLMLVGEGHTESKHFAFHKKEEEWSLKEFDEDYDSIHYGSTHTVKCSKCNYQSERNRIWPKKSAWPMGIGSTVEEAREKAEKLSEE